MNSPVVIILVVVAIAVLAWLLRGGARDETVAHPEPPAEDEPAAPAAFVEADLDEAEELAVSSDGELFIPDGHAVRVMPLGDPGQIAAHREDIDAGLIALDTETRTQLRQMRMKPGYPLQAGDLTAARIKRGAAGVVPWRLETLGRDGDYGFFAFETEDGARAALALLVQFDVVRRPRDEDGNIIPPSLEDFEEARRRYEETERQLAIESDDEPEGVRG